MKKSVAVSLKHKLLNIWDALYVYLPESPKGLDAEGKAVLNKFRTIIDGLKYSSITSIEDESQK